MGRNTRGGQPRRSFLQAAGAVGLAGAAGCLDQLSEEQEFDVLHGWAAGDGQEAIQALVEGFQESHPDIDFGVQDVQGGARDNLETVVSRRLRDGDPPSTWQEWPGANLLQFGDNLGDIEGDVWDDEMKENYLEGPQEAARPDGTYVAVPLNIHRINNLFYNVAVVEEAGVDPESIDGPEALVDAFQAVAENTEATPFANGTGELFTVFQLWETIFLAQAGADAYDELINGEFDDVDAVRDSLALLAEYVEFFPDDHFSTSFTEANERVIDGEAAFIHQGDWAAGAYRNRDGFDYGDNWDHVPFPGTEGLYALNMDSFTYPADNPTPEDTKTFLSYVGSTDAQERFNPLKGSIPPRVDVDESEFPPFLQQQIGDFRDSDAQPPSIAHGAAVPPAIRGEVEDAIDAYLGNFDPDDHAPSLLSAFSA
ncbi:ABC transporter substrate-binding protein [Halopiger aswanensis]|uniref:Carbohydrate ABC transporter substrate-binding protein (CUT1 family) n=1 Tax=Halopiger aswanensis TaxID=148449 RepID=A0A3R7E248_9EURY|nr:ABC transporter substrate-binding protein [Halopiger aswanensis]RKD98313.1 carbohydrate ABC transporter substrate-binding protein (CUT1 family) [Halopiger aswanensis]